MYGGHVLKLSLYYWKQERWLVVTDRKVLVFKPNKELKRKIKIKQLTGISINKRKASLEMVIHVAEEPDFRF